MIVKSVIITRDESTLVRSTDPCCEEMAKGMLTRGRSGSVEYARDQAMGIMEPWRMGVWGVDQNGMGNQVFLPFKLCPWCGEPIGAVVVDHRPDNL